MQYVNNVHTVGKYNKVEVYEMKEKLKELSKKWWFWVIVIIALGGFFGGTSEEEVTSKEDNNVQEVEKIVFLKGSDSDEYIKALEGVTGIEGTEAKNDDDTISYSNSNSKYGIKLIANKSTKEISYVRIEALTSEDATNVFMSLNRMDYETQNAGDFTSWLVKNLGKESTTKIGDANFLLTLSTSNNPIIEMKTDGYEG